MFVPPGERQRECCTADRCSCTTTRPPQCAQLISTFCQFFVDKVKRIRDNISAALQSSVRRTFAIRQHLGPQLSSFEPVTTEEVRKLLSGMPSKSSPLDVLPCSLLKSCAHVFTPAIARLANLSLQTGKFPARYKSAQVLPLLKKAGLDSSQPEDYSGRSPTCRPCPRSWETRVGTPAAPTCSALPTSASSNLHTERDIPQRLHY